MPFDTYTWTDGQAIGTYLLNRYQRDSMRWLYDQLPTRTWLFHDEALVTNGNAITSVIDVNQEFATVSYQNASAINDSWTFSVVLLPATYSFMVVARYTSGSGKLALYLDSLQLIPPDSLDMYVAGASTNNNRSGTVWTVTEGKRYTLTGVVESKNAASSGYDCQLTYIVVSPSTLANVGGDI